MPACSSQRTAGCDSPSTAKLPELWNPVRNKHQRGLTPELLEQILGPALFNQVISKVSEAIWRDLSIRSQAAHYDTILETVVNHFNITLDDLRSQRRSERLSRPRFIAAYLLRQTGLSYPTIGAILHRHHSSIIHAVTTISASPGYYAKDLQTLQQELFNESQVD